MATEDLGATEGQPISVVIPFWGPVLFGFHYSQISRSYYLFFNYLSYYLKG